MPPPLPDLQGIIGSLAWLGGIAFALSLILTPIVRDIFRAYGVEDRPDNGRKNHTRPTPRVGGIAIALSYVGAFLLAPVVQGSMLRGNLSLAWRLLPAVSVVFATGIIDDLSALKPWQKLTGQFAAAIMAYFAGIRVLLIAGGPAEAWWSFPATVLWLLLCTNAFNLVDGMDGLAGGIGLFATLTIFIAALVHQSPSLALATIPLAGCLLGFLCYNFNPATIFLGDSGSLLIGFLVGCFGILWTQKSATLLGMTAPIMALSIPLLDTGLCILRRSLKRQPIFSADRGHIHHKLLDRGFTPRRAVLAVYAVCSVVACFSLLQSALHSDRVKGALIVIFCAVACMGVQYLGYAEFSVAGKMLFSGAFQQTLKLQLDLQNFERKIGKAANLDECWRLLQEVSAQCGFRCERLFLADDSFIGPGTAESSIPGAWRMRIPLPRNGYLEFERLTENAGDALVVGPFFETINRSLIPRLRRLQRGDEVRPKTLGPNVPAITPS